jgi:hypothetical protein
MKLTEYAEGLRQSADAINAATLLAIKHAKLLESTADDPDLAVEIGAKEGGRLRDRATEIAKELAPVADAVGVFLGQIPVADAGALVLLHTAHEKLRSAMGRMTIAGRTLTEEETSRMDKLSHSTRGIEEAISALGGEKPANLA